MTAERWSPAYTIGQLTQFFAFNLHSLVLLAEVGMLRQHPSCTQSLGALQVYGLDHPGGLAALEALLARADTARRLQGGPGIPPDCTDVVDRSVLVDLLRAHFIRDHIAHPAVNRGWVISGPPRS